MPITEILSAGRVAVANSDHPVVDKPAALRKLAELLASGAGGVGADDVERVLVEREKLQSTGVGGGVAIPHGAIDRVDRLVGALLLVPPIPFEAIDAQPVTILFAVIGPKRATGEHLKTLARVARLFRDEAFRRRLLDAKSGDEAYGLISAEEGRGAATA